MMGTLATLLAGRKIPTFSDRYRADVEGDIADSRDALKTYITQCPAAMSVRGCIEIIDSAQVNELPA